MCDLVNIQHVCYQGGNIENILETSMLNFNGTFPNSWDLSIISHMNDQSSREIHMSEGLFGGNHMIGSS